MGSYDGAKLCEFIGTCLLEQLYTKINNNDCGLYKDDCLMIQEYINVQQIDQLRKKIRKIFKEIDFKTDIETNFKIADFLHVTVNMINSSYKSCKKPNDTLLYINGNSNHPPETIKKLPKTINNRLSRNSSNAQIFHASEVEYETALKTIGYKNVDFKYKLESKNNNRRNRQRYIKLREQIFLDLLYKHFASNNHLHKIFNRNTVKVRYFSTPNVTSIIKLRNKNLINAENKQTKDCNCRKNEESSLGSICRSDDIIYKCVVTVKGHPQKAY